MLRLAPRPQTGGYIPSRAHSDRERLRADGLNPRCGRVRELEGTPRDPSAIKSLGDPKDREIEAGRTSQDMTPASAREEDL